MSVSFKKIYGLLGHPLGHSLSPLMHNAAFSHLGINAEYKLFDVPPQDLDKFFSLTSGDICGLNVTVPYKEKVLGLAELDGDSLYLKKVNALNTLVRCSGGWRGFNTDIPGFIRHLREGFDPEGKKAAILGAGGASRAVVYALASSGVKEMVVFDVDPLKSMAVSKMIKEVFPGYPISAVARPEELRLEDKELLVNATPAGLKGGDPCAIDPGLLHGGLFVYDLIYNPQETKLLKEAKAKGARTLNGLGMLLYQGALSFEYFTGKTAPIEVMRSALQGGVSI